MDLRKKHFSLIMVFVALCTMILSCNFDRTEEKTSLLSQDYGIEPESLLDAIGSGAHNAFVPLDTEPERIPPDQQIPVNWTQADYLTIANALSEFVWEETLEGWQLNSMVFLLGCADFDVGFQNGRFRFFKNARISEHEIRIMRLIDIDPRSKFINVTEVKYEPKLVDWKSIDIQQNQLSADEVLQSAENAGGQQQRLSVKNACNISLLLSPDYANYNGWEVDYTRRDDNISIFHVQIDPYTGEIHFP